MADRALHMPTLHGQLDHDQVVALLIEGVCTSYPNAARIAVDLTVDNGTLHATVSVTARAPEAR